MHHHAYRRGRSEGLAREGAETQIPKRLTQAQVGQGWEVPTLTCRRGWPGKREQVWPSGPTPRISRSNTGMASPWKA